MVMKMVMVMVMKMVMAMIFQRVASPDLSWPPTAPPPPQRLVPELPSNPHRHAKLQINHGYPVTFIRGRKPAAAETHMNRDAAA